jgi:2-iminobutanoate/2-iminopropanoate deaminase
MNALVNPSSIGAPAAAYSLGVVSSAGSRLLHTSGIVATRADGSVPETLAEQAVVIWDAISAICESAGFESADIVSYTTYVVQGEDLSVVMAARDTALLGHRPASTLIVVPQLARPAWRMEIAVVAARDPSPSVLP